MDLRPGTIEPRLWFVEASGVDWLIAACAIRRGLPVLHNGRDFDLISQVSPLESRRVRAR